MSIISCYFMFDYCHSAAFIFIGCRFALTVSTAAATAVEERLKPPTSLRRYCEILNNFNSVHEMISFFWDSTFSPSFALLLLALANVMKIIYVRKTAYEPRTRTDMESLDELHGLCRNGTESNAPLCKSTFGWDKWSSHCDFSLL